MRLLAGKKPCVHCGHQVREPRSDQGHTYCSQCGQLLPPAARDRISQEDRRDQARAAYEEALTRLTAGEGVAPAELAQLQLASGYTPAERATLAATAVAVYAEKTMADDVMTPRQADHVADLLAKLGVSWAMVGASCRADLVARIEIGQANAGLLPVIDHGKAALKPNEVAHYQCEAELIEDATVGEPQDDRQGVSIPIGKPGLRYRIGSAREHRVATGNQAHVADVGLLMVTSVRVLYMGSAKTHEFVHNQLLRVDVLSNGVRLHVSNPDSRCLFTVPNGEVIAAMINAAATHDELATA